MATTPPDQSLSRVIARAATGDHHAWHVLVETYTHRLYGLLVRQCGDRDLAQEITQATFVKILTKLEDYQEQGQFEPWLFRIAINRLRDEMRRRKRQARTSAPLGDGRDGDEDGDSWSAIQTSVAGRAPWAPDDPLEQVSTQEQLERLRAAIATLPPADRRILELRHTAGLSFAQIAQTLDQPLGTVLARGHRALGKLRTIMTADQDARAPKDSEA